MKQILQAIKSLFRKVEIRNNAVIKEVSNLLETVRAELKRTVANITRLLDSKADKQSPKFEGTVTTDYLQVGNSTATGVNSAAMGSTSTASGANSYAFGISCTASGNYSFAACRQAKATGANSFACGSNTEANGQSSHAEGTSTKAEQGNAHAEGHATKATGANSHAEGNNTIASGGNSHAEGYVTTASGDDAHAEGGYSKAKGSYSHAEGFSTEAKGEHSHAEGQATIASGLNQHAQGQANIEDTENKYLHIVGNGIRKEAASGNGYYFERSNAHTLDWQGNAWFAGEVYVGGTGQDDPNAKKLGFGGGVTSWNDLTDKPAFSTVSRTGRYADLINCPVGTYNIYSIPIMDVTFVGNRVCLTEEVAGYRLNANILRFDNTISTISYSSIYVNGAYVYGNPFLYDKSQTDNGINLAIVYINKEGYIYSKWAYTRDEYGDKTHIIAAYHESEKILNEKYIPDTIARVEDIPTETEIQSLIDASLGVIENGTY